MAPLYLCMQRSPAFENFVQTRDVRFSQAPQALFGRRRFYTSGAEKVNCVIFLASRSLASIILTSFSPFPRSSSSLIHSHPPSSILIIQGSVTSPVPARVPVLALPNKYRRSSCTEGTPVDGQLDTSESTSYEEAALIVRKGDIPMAHMHMGVKLPKQSLLQAIT